MSDTRAIETQDLKKSFKDVVVLDGIDMSVERGAILALLGPNGAGKTTTIRILSTLLLPDGGRAFVNGYDVVRQADGVRHSIGLTGQYAAVDELLTGYENLHMMGRLYRLSAKAAARRAWDLLEQFDLAEAASRTVKTYSGGMRRRLDLAASLVTAPPIIFLDEPTTGLDPRSRLMMWDMIKGLVRSGSTILLTTQYLEEANMLADRIVVIDGGKIIAEGTADELKQRVGNERIEFIIAEDSDFNAAIVAIDGDAVEVDEPRRAISLASDGSVRELKLLLDRLEERRIELDGLSLHRPTLDDVFLMLTGHQATQETAEAEEAVAATGRGQR
jgi:ABC-2 type transport system ATP-binding protein